MSFCLRKHNASALHGPAD